MMKKKNLEGSKNKKRKKSPSKRKIKRKHDSKVRKLKSTLDWMEVESFEGNQCIVNDNNERYYVKGIKIHPLNIHMLDSTDNYNVIQSLSIAFNKINFKVYWKFVYQDPNLSVQNHNLMRIIKNEEDEAIQDIANMFLYFHEWFTQNFKEISFYFIVMENEKMIDKVYSDLKRFMNDTSLKISEMMEDDFRKIVAYDFDNPVIDEYYFSVLKGLDMFDIKDGKLGIGGTK